MRWVLVRRSDREELVALRRLRAGVRVRVVYTDGEGGEELAWSEGPVIRVTSEHLTILVPVDLLGGQMVVPVSLSVL